MSNAISSKAKEYEAQLTQKHNMLSELLREFSPGDLAVFRSDYDHYRMRAEFRVWHDGDDLYHIMFDQETRQPYRVDHFLPASVTINNVMTDIISDIKSSPLLRKKLFQIDYLSGLSKEVVVSLLYHRQLDDEWRKEAQALHAKLSQKYNVSIIGRARKQKHIIGNDYIIETLPINGRDYHFKHIENSFTQPNAKVNCKMIEWTLEFARSLDGDLLELYCGAGNFSLPLASQFNHVIGTEIAKPSVAAAQYNIDKNAINNVDIVRLSAEEFVEAMEGKRTFSRLGDIDLTRYRFNTVLVDPPRAGLDPATLDMVSRFDNIIYISCNPETLADNLKHLCNTHVIDQAALFDQFPYTHHVETGVCLKRKTSK